MLFLLRGFWRLLVGLLAIVGLLVVLLVGGIAGGGWWLKERLDPSARALPESMVLVWDLREPLADEPGSGPLRRLGLDDGRTVTEIVLALDRAGRDPRVKGLLARLDATGHGFAKAQELRDAVRRFAASGRFTIAYADSFGEMGAGNEGYYLATAFEQIHLQPVGLVGLTGLMAEVPFARDLLDRIGIRLDIDKRSDYKTAFDSLVTQGATQAHQEMLESILDSLNGQLVAGIAEGRQLEPARVQALIDGGPYTDREALDARLVDALDYWDQVVHGAETMGGRQVALDRYAGATEDGPAGSGAGDGAAVPVALMQAAGMIHGGESGALGGIGADDLAAALDEAIEAPSIKAILLRLDSPGGSAVASETVARQLRRAEAAGKPVIVSMGNVAGSGGYWIAMDASRIIAQPATLTGSIGVIAGKPVLSGLWEKLGVDWLGLPRGLNAGMWSINQPYDARGRARLEQLLDRIYGDFVAGVAEGRGMTVAEVERVAKGRVWTGAQAQELGLVDALGGTIEALAATRAALGLAEDAALALEPFPRHGRPLEEALRFLDGQVRMPASLARLLEAGWSGAVMTPIALR